jgi:hypothetical protein
MTHTTGAVVLHPQTTAGAICPPSNPEAPLASSAGGAAPESSELSAPSEETRVPPAASPTEPAYERAPLYDPQGGTVSDVGEPYPLPSVPPVSAIDSRPVPARPAASAQPDEASYFPESSFGPNYRP